MKTTANGRIFTIEMPSAIDAQCCNEILKESKGWLKKSLELYALDFANTNELKPSFYRPLLTFSNDVREADRKLVSFNLQTKIDYQIRMDGLSKALNVVPNLKQFVDSAFLPKPPELDVKMINPFLEAAKMTLEKQAQVKCEAQKPKLVSVNEKNYSVEIAITGVIALNSEKFNGSISLAFPEAVFLKIYESMFGEKVDKITADIEDAAGELLNIIYGSAKTKLNDEHGCKLTPSLPTILSGHNINIRQKTFEKVIVLPFETAFGPFHIEIAFNPMS